MTGLVCVQTFAHRYEADLIKSLLEAYGIRAWVMADDCGGTRPLDALSGGGARLMVPREAAARARDLVQVDYPIPAEPPVPEPDALPIAVGGDIPPHDPGTSRVFPKRRRGRPGAEALPSSGPDEGESDGL